MTYNFTLLLIVTQMCQRSSSEVNWLHGKQSLKWKTIASVGFTCWEEEEEERGRREAVQDQPHGTLQSINLPLFSLMLSYKTLAQLSPCFHCHLSIWEQSCSPLFNHRHVSRVTLVPPCVLPHASPSSAFISGTTARQQSHRSLK